MKAIVTHYSDLNGLTAMMMLLQAQVTPLEEIIVIDTSPNKTGLEICQRFTTSIVPVKVECARVGIYEAWNRGIELAGESDVLIMNDDLIIPINLTDILELVEDATHAYCIVPNTPDRTHYKNYVDMKLGFFAQEPKTVKDVVRVKWMPGFCFFLSKECVKDVGNFDLKYKVWFGDSDYETRIHAKSEETGNIAIVGIPGTFVYHFGGKSYAYQSKEVQRKIAKDRKLYFKKYPNVEKTEKPLE